MGSTSDFPETVYSFYSIDEVSTLLKSEGFEESAIQNAETPPGQMFLAVAQRPYEVRYGTDRNGAT
jgi:hypothetical protein